MVIMNEQKIMSILLEPKVTEKSSMIGELNNQYVFKVSKDATKPEIKPVIPKIVGNSPNGKRINVYVIILIAVEKFLPPPLGNNLKPALL